MPDGRFRWIVFSSVLFTYLLISSQRTAPGLITDQLMLEFEITATTIGLLTSIQFFIYTGLQIPMGMLADRYGPNFFLIIGALLTGFGTVLYSISTHEMILMVARMLIGIGDATIWVNMVLILSQWFSAKEFPRLIGITAMTGSLGFLLATVPFALWIELFGWRVTFFTTGMLLCFTGLLLLFVLVLKPKQPLFHQGSRGHEKFAPLLRRIFSTRQAWALFLCHFGIVGTYVGFISSWGVPFGITMYGMSRAEASQLLMLGLIGALIGAPLAGWISARLGKIKSPYIIVHLILLLSWSSFLLWKGQPPVSILLILFFIIGLAYGANALTFAAVRKTFPIKEAGIVSGFANTGGFLSAVLLPSIFGKVLDVVQITTGGMHEGFYYGFFIPMLFSAIGLIGVLMVKEKGQPQEDY